jgi:hypothetical protein
MKQRRVKVAYTRPKMVDMMITLDHLVGCAYLIVYIDPTQELEFNSDRRITSTAL